MRYRAIVGVCFGSISADLRQSVNVEFQFGGKTARGFKRAALQAARREYPALQPFLTSNDAAVVAIPIGVAYPILSVPRGVWSYNPQRGFTELKPTERVA